MYKSLHIGKNLLRYKYNFCNPLMFRSQDIKTILKKRWSWRQIVSLLKKDTSNWGTKTRGQARLIQSSIQIVQQCIKFISERECQKNSRIYGYWRCRTFIQKSQNWRLKLKWYVKYIIPFISTRPIHKLFSFWILSFSRSFLLLSPFSITVDEHTSSWRF